MSDHTPSYNEMATAAAAVLAGWHDSETGTWPECWWQSAKATEALIDYALLTGDRSHDEVLRRTFDRAQSQAVGFLNKYYDDEGWWGLTWIKAFDLTQEQPYLDMAIHLFQDMTRGWDETSCGGGVWWTKEETYKNAIPNELFMVLAARLYHRLGEATYLEWAQRECDWFLASGMLNEEGLINDGLTAEGANNGGTTWTYNQGVILGGLAELHRAGGNQELVQIAQSIAVATTSQLVSPDGILRESCEDPNADRPCDGDQELFKGIFTLYLAQLHDLTGLPQYGDFIQRNAASLWRNGRNPSDEFGLRWTGPFDGSSVQRQTAALDLFNAAVQVSSSLHAAS